jgi:phosphomannomutase
MADLGAIFKAYDVRGLVPSQLDKSTTRQIGGAFADEVLDGSSESAVVVGHDMRSTSVPLSNAFSDGVRDRGADVVRIGLASTDQLYFASGRLRLPGAMFTASHNPAAYNGIKLCRAGAVALSSATGLDAIRARLETGRTVSPVSPRGTVEDRDLLESYASYLLGLVPVRGRRLKVVVDAGSGMAGHTVPAVLGRLDIDLVAMYFELDGSFPHHEANPLDPANLEDLQEAVIAEGADVGLAFDGDADRCFVIDEQGSVVSPSALTALIAVRCLAEEPGARIIHNLITSRAVPEIIRRHGGVAIRTRVGHSLIKATMADQNAAFGGEHSGHFYFRDFWYADSGMLAALHLLASLAGDESAVSELVDDLDPYFASGEINTVLADTGAVLAAVADSYGGRPGITLDRLDGLTVSADEWWFNVRASNTEALVRLNVEGTTTAIMADVRDEVVALMRRTT